MAARRTGLGPRATQPAPATAASAATRLDTVSCQSYLLARPDGTQIEDQPLPGAHRCFEEAVWRVTFSGTLTDTGRAALRLKCGECAESARETFGPEQVALRPL